MNNKIKPRVIIVNENDEIIWYKERLDILQDDIYRVSGLVIKNSNNEFLLAQRSFNKKNNPWIWSISVAGTVEEWESYDENIIHEIEEEIWIKNLEFKKIDKLRKYWEHNFFVQFYFAKLDKDIEEFFIQKEEVERVRWFNIDEIKKWTFEWNEISSTLINNLLLFN